MRYVFILSFFLATASSVQAAFLYQQEIPAEKYELTDIAGETIYGVLDNAPHTFTFAVTETTPFSMQVAMSPHLKIHDVSLILVKQEKRGVSEIGRSDTSQEQWQPKYDFLRALVLLWGQKQEYLLQPGIYTFEVSSPENNRGYRLVIGKGDTSLYKELRYARTVFEVDLLSILFSPLIFVPILAVLGAVLYIRRNKVKHA
jgi:hypothetical protein